ncbi:MAG: hypothetical protein E6R04_04855 [Spirochaetes bacterium]|nr:MAG: hypothetical protein E6R04_04855 [Spirochaetota bacterium]
MSRFDYVKYDEEAIKKQARLKILHTKMEKALEEVEACRQEIWAEAHEVLPDDKVDAPRDRALDFLNKATGPDIDEALSDLEHSYMWLGKAIRDDQINRNGAADLQEGRTDS